MVGRVTDSGTVAGNPGDHFPEYPTAPRDGTRNPVANGGSVTARERAILAGLNPAQVEAVTHEEGPLLILAGAGSGKTTVLIRRVAWLLNRGVDPSNILAITFTNKAADELKGRLVELLGDAVRGIWAMTFHSACARILRASLAQLASEAEGRASRSSSKSSGGTGSIGVSPNFAIADASDQLALVRKVLKDLDLSERQYPPRSFLNAISRAKDELIGPEEFARRAVGFYESKVAEVYKGYQRKLIELDLMDFDDLIFNTVKLFEENPAILRRYQERFQHILVDEYQDTNHAQYVLVKLLAGLHRNLAVVGDDDQSIYTFRGADIRNILEFEKDYPDAHVVRLEQNYRSTQVILDAAYHVISKNYYRKEKRLWTSKKGGLPITVYAAENPTDEAQYVASELLALAKKGVPLGSAVILYRTHAQSRPFEEVFVREGIPYSVVGSLRFYDRKEIKDALSYLRLVVYPRDYLSLERIINEPPRGLGPSSLERISRYAAETGKDLVQALLEAHLVPGLKKPQIDQAQALGRILRDLGARGENAPPDEILQEVLQASGYRGYLEREGTPEALERLENLDELLAAARAFRAQGGTLGAFLDQLALVSDQDTYRQRADVCTMMTLHAAKGLEFPVVFMVGMEEGSLPHIRSLGDQKQLEEERRLCYVGMTRAKEKLYLTFSMTKWGSLGSQPCEVSRFLRDVPEKLLDIRGGGGYA
ncbi:MAG: UvrD-helicase domain-containing protein [Firmicutes bacterium]|nr:UvrD-helicase domain-containing protein [Candidatus Fermentithermobacillaceae bacterium]